MNATIGNRRRRRQDMTTSRSKTVPSRTRKGPPLWDPKTRTPKFAGLESVSIYPASVRSCREICPLSDSIQPGELLPDCHCWAVTLPPKLQNASRKQLNASSASSTRRSRSAHSVRKAFRSYEGNDGVNLHARSAGGATGGIDWQQKSVEWKRSKRREERERSANQEEESKRTKNAWAAARLKGEALLRKEEQAQTRYHTRVAAEAYEHKNKGFEKRREEDRLRQGGAPKICW
jgi:hypothetical protein